MSTKRSIHSLIISGKVNTMPDLKFTITAVQVKEFAIVPTLSFQLQIQNMLEKEEVYAAGLKCQIMIEAIKRTYNDSEKEKLIELFGPSFRWDETLRSFTWTIINIPVPRFTGQTNLEFTIACSEDQALAAGKYFHAIEDGIIPMAFLFSGTLFYKDENSQLQVTLVPWEKEALYKMPVKIWQDMMNIHFPGVRWVSLNAEVYDKLIQYKASTIYPTLNACLEHLLEEALHEIADPNHQS